MMDFHVFLYLVDIGKHHPLQLWENGNIQRIAGLSRETREEGFKIFII